MRILISIAALLFTITLSAQDQMHVTLEESSDSKCLSINLTSINPEDLHLKGQNYRFFYNDANLDFEGVKVNSELLDNNFDSQIALHRDGLSKEINGKIPFETSLGFVSMNIMPQNNILDHVRMTFWQKVNIADVCFAQDVKKEDVILASKKATNQYSKAYCVIDWESADQQQFTSDLESLGVEGIDDNK